MTPLSWLIVGLVTTGSALCWWPVIMRPNVDLPFWWFPLVLIGLAVALANILEHWAALRIMVASLLGTSAGLVAGFRIWWPIDRIDASYVPLVVLSAMLASTIVSIVIGLIFQCVSVVDPKRRQIIWVALVVCIAIGPVITALMPALVARRMTLNQRVTEARMASLSDAVVQTIEEHGARRAICLSRVTIFE